MGVRFLQENLLLNCVAGTLESPLDSKEIQPVHPQEISPEYSLEGLMLKLRVQYFAPEMKNLLIGADPDAEKY